MSGAGTIVSAQTILSSGAGRLGGVVVDGATKSIFHTAMRAIGVTIQEVSTSTAIGGNPKVAAQYSSAQRTITVKSGATVYEYAHEMFHALNDLWIGTTKYAASPKVEREQVVYDMMKLFMWGYLSDGEQANATFNVQRYGGVP